MKWYLKVLKNYAVFTGRASRTEYWMFVLFNIIFCTIAIVIDHLLGTTFNIDSLNGAVNFPYGYFYLVYVLAVLIPGLAVFVRRLHDIGKTGWYFLVAIIPIVGAIWLLILLVTDSNPGANKYGTNPNEIAE
jgi:uncharacterized membrane protein YhaH (DUF805 family)